VSLIIAQEFNGRRNDETTEVPVPVVVVADHAITLLIAVLPVTIETAVGSKKARSRRNDGKL
jgi:hypothetical protein